MALPIPDDVLKQHALDAYRNHAQGQLGGLLGQYGVGMNAAQQQAMNRQSAHLKQHVDQSKIAARDEGLEKEKAEAQRVALLLLL